MFSRFFLFLFLIFFKGLFAQERDLKIVEILDANLFKTEDSLLIRMVNLRVPSISDQDSIKSEQAIKIIKFAELHLLNRTSRFIISPKKKCSENPIQSGHLFRKYPLANTNINEKYIEKGYAFYLPCDTMFMDVYSMVAERALEKKAGLWSAPIVKRKPDYFNRFRTTSWHFRKQLEADDFVPIIGFNYRWSDIYSFVDYKSVNLNLSAETGAFFFLVLPYANLGVELRSSPFYVRAHYDLLVPFPFMFFTPGNEWLSYPFYGYDAGIMIPFTNRTGFELEVNLKHLGGDLRTFFSISFVAY